MSILLLVLGRVLGVLFGVVFVLFVVLFRRGGDVICTCVGRGVDAG